METAYQHTSDWGRVYNPRSFLLSKIPPPIISRASSLIKTSLARSFRSGTTGRVSIVCKHIIQQQTINQTASRIQVVSLVKIPKRGNICCSTVRITKKYFRVLLVERTRKERHYSWKTWQNWEPSKNLNEVNYSITEIETAYFPLKSNSLLRFPIMYMMWLYNIRKNLRKSITWFI